MDKLKCEVKLRGFTVGETYNVLSNHADRVEVLNDYYVSVKFGKTEGDNDFKNWFTSVKQEKPKGIKWKDVFDCSKVFPKPFHECVNVAKSVGYDYMSFNGMVVSVDANSTSDFICLEKDLVV